MFLVIIMVFVTMFLVIIILVTVFCGHHSCGHQDSYGYYDRRVHLAISRV